MKRHANPRYALQWAKHGARWFRANESDDGSITFDHLRWLRQDKTCAYCGCTLTSKTREFDHVQPLAQGGTHTADNLVVTCRPCNRLKRDKPFLQWIAMIGQRLSVAA
jgi:5-methylcytosine-specific restriction endonuclease McrA